VRIFVVVGLFQMMKVDLDNRVRIDTNGGGIARAYRQKTIPRVGSLNAMV